MNRLGFILFISILLSITYSCTKEETEETTIIGRWEWRELLDYSQMNGVPQWQIVPPESRDIWEFQPDSNFIEIEFRGNPLPDTCFGSYLLLSNSELQITTSCQVHTDTLEISLKSQTLIFTYIGREGNIYEKYVKVK